MKQTSWQQHRMLHSHRQLSVNRSSTDEDLSGCERGAESVDSVSRHVDNMPGSEGTAMSSSPLVVQYPGYQKDDSTPIS